MRSLKRHGHLASSSIVAALLEQYEGRAPTQAVRGDERSAALGLDVDELQPARRAIPIAAYLREVPDSAVARNPVWATLRPAGAQPRLAEVQLDWDAVQRGFTGVLPGQPPGLYDVEVETRAVLAAGDLRTAETVQVIDEE